MCQSSELANAYWEMKCWGDALWSFVITKEQLEGVNLSLIATNQLHLHMEILSDGQFQK